MREAVEYQAQSLKSVFLHQEKAESSESYREAHDSLDISASISNNIDVVGVIGGGMSISSAYAETNSIIESNKDSTSWSKTEKQEFQDGRYQIFRQSTTTIIIDGKLGKTVVRNWVNSGKKAQTDAQLRKRAREYLLNKYHDQPERVRGTAFSIVFCAKRNRSPYQCYHWTTRDNNKLSSGSSQRQVCEGHGYVFSQGNDNLAPGCGGCWCCQPTSGLYRPFGPQTSVPEKKVSGGGWRKCHVERYDVEITDSSISQIQGKCTGDKIMLACRRIGASFLTALAWADRATVFGVTDSAMCTDSCSGHVVQGTKWYRTTIGSKESGAWGFADGASVIHLQSTDILDSDGDKRLSWFVNVSGNGGYNCGTTTWLNVYNSQLWEKVIFHAD